MNASVSTNQQTRRSIKVLIVESLHLEGLSPDAIEDDQPLFEQGGLGLDSIDALELLVALEKAFHIKIPTNEAGPETFASVRTLAGLVEKHQGAARAARS
jgi:acyl carrier protein